LQINISARHGHLSPGIQEKITEKVEGIRRFLDRITAIQVTVDLEHRDAPTLELCVDAEHHDDFVATVQADTVLAALDGCIEKVEQQLRKFKERLKEHKATGHKHLEPPADEE
jgi:ribosome hibernation promoting factor